VRGIETVAKYPRRLANFYLPDTGQLSFILLFASIGAILSASAILTYMSVQDVSDNFGQPDVIVIDSQSAEEEVVGDLSEAEALEGGASGEASSSSSSSSSLVAIGIIALAIVFILIAFGLVLSHRLFGPIYRLRGFIEDLKAGSYDKRLTQRGNDIFQILATHLNDLASELGKMPSAER